ncbi:MAG: DUF6198 family protein [Bacillota bacterium]|nr:DUF6198 family protein [Bacillota bacterium]
MNKRETARRYTIFMFGQMFVALGVAFTTKSALGTSPISSIPYSLSLILPALSLGAWTILFNYLLIFFQVAILKRNCKIFQIILQFFITLIFGYFIDFWMLCLKPVNPHLYIMKIITLLIGCLVMSFGLYLQYIGNVVMLPGDAFIRAISDTYRKDFGKTRMVSDITMSSIAVILCIIFLGGLYGVREGTLIAALLIGNLFRLLIRRLTKLTAVLIPEKEAAA